VSPVLLDTGCIVALLDRSERHHRRCIEAIGAVSDPLVTCEAVIAEACYLLRGLPGAVDAVLANVETRTFDVPFTLGPSCRAIRALLRRHRPGRMDLADACLVHMADLLDSGRILTLDRDFDVYRWRRSRPFERLIPLEG